MKKTAIDILVNHSFAITLNANDFFNYACADVVELDTDDLHWVTPIVEKYGSDGVHAVMSHIAKNLPIEPWQTPIFLMALEEIKQLNPEVFSEY